MAFCKNCGSPVEGAFCPKCGTPAAAPAAGSYTPPPPAPQAYAPAPGPAVAAAPAPATAVENENLMGALAYLVGFITGILFLVLAPYNQSKFVRFHAFQSIFLNAAMIVVSIVVSILSTILGVILPFGIGVALFGLLWLVIWVGFMILWIMLMVKAYQGQRWSLPIIGALAAKQA